MALINQPACSDERTQVRIAMVAALLTVGLVLIVMLLMAFIEYQSRLMRYQPGIRTSEIMDSVARETGIRDEVERQKILTPSLQEALEKLQLAETQVTFRIERICSLFGASDVNAKPDSGVGRCRTFLGRIPFDGTLVEGGSAAIQGAPRDETTSDNKPMAFSEAVLNSFVREMGSDGPENNSRLAAYLPLFSADIVKIARLNQAIYTELTFEFERQKQAYLTSCYRNARLSAGIKYQDALYQDCDVGVNTGSGDKDASNKTTPPAMAGAGQDASSSSGPPSPPTAPQIGQGQLGSPRADNPVISDPNLLDKQRRFDLVRQFQIYSTLSLGWAQTMLLSPPDYLATWLLFFGGALGSTLKILFWHIMPIRKNRWSYLLVEPAQGIVCAVMLFILFRSGVVVIAGSSSPSLDAPPLSPYFVAFMAIGAGLTSDQVLMAFRTAATAMIGKGAWRDASRWAVGLQQALDARAAGGCVLTVEEFIDRIDVERLKFDDWLSFKIPVEPEYQERIRLVLGVPAWKLFTDIDPKIKPTIPPSAEQTETEEVEDSLDERANEAEQEQDSDTQTQTDAENAETTSQSTDPETRKNPPE